MTAEETAREMLINEANRKGILKLFKEANQKEAKAADYLQQARDRYENILIILSASGVPWAKITFTIQTEVFEDWPVKETGTLQGIKDLLKGDYEPAIWVNRFNAYRQSKYTDYDVLKVVEAPPKLTDMTPEQRLEYRLSEARKNTEKRITTPHVISRDLIRHDIFELFTYTNKLGNQKAQALVIQLFDELFGETGEKIHELTEIVEINKNNIIHPPEPEKEITEADVVVK